MSDPHPGPGPETLQVGRSAGVVTITLDRPHRKNAVDAVMLDELGATFRAIGAPIDDRVVVITGAGGAFCSGAELSPQGGVEPGSGRHAPHR